jgi:ribose 5-phosphate isomerase B
MIIPIASDHAGFEAKETVKRLLDEQQVTTVDFGTGSNKSVDYPDYAAFVAQTVNRGEHERGILICGTGQGMSMTANKYQNVRAAVVWNEEMARLSREHNNANILCLPGRFLNEEQLRSIVTAWLETGFEGGRHQRRIDKIQQQNG